MGKLSESLSNVLDFIADFNKSPRSSMEPGISADKQNVMVSKGARAQNQYNCASCRIVSSLTLFSFGGMAIYQTINKAKQLSGIRRKLVMFGGGLLSFGLTAVALTQALDLKVFDRNNEGRPTSGK